MYAYVGNNPVNWVDLLGLTMSAGELGTGNPGSYGGTNTQESMYGSNGLGTGNDFGGGGEEGGFWSGIRDYLAKINASYLGVGVTGLVHIGPAGVSLHAGLAIGLLDNQLCAYVSGCLRAGPGLYTGGGYEGIIGAGSNTSTEDQLNGRTYGVGADYGLLESGGAGGVAMNGNGIGSASGRGGAGFGASAGVDTCETKAICH